MKDGSPQVTPTWVDIDKSNDTILVNTAKGRIKQRNVSTDPRVAVSVVDFSNPHHMATVRGKVIEQLDHTTIVLTSFYDFSSCNFHLSTII
jgi:hypothetical protein